MQYHSHSLCPIHTFHSLAFLLSLHAHHMVPWYILPCDTPLPTTSPTFRVGSFESHLLGCITYIDHALTRTGVHCNYLLQDASLSMSFCSCQTIRVIQSLCQV